MNDIREFAVKLAAALRKHAADYRQVTGRGGVRDWAEFQRRVGHASGYEDAAKAVEDFYRNFLVDDQESA